MEIKAGDLVKKLRKESGLKKEEFADEICISVRTLTRIESDDAKIDPLTFVFVMEKFGNPTQDFWLLYLESDEYGIYKKYKKLRRFIRDNDIELAKAIISEIESSKFIRNPFIEQYISYAKIVVGSELHAHEKVNELWNVLYISHKNFDESKLKEKRLTYIEISILSLISSQLFKIGDHNRAIKILEDIIESRSECYATEEDRGMLYPMLMFNLSNFLGKCGRYKESLAMCCEALDIGIQYNNLRFIPHLWYNIACNSDKLGEDKPVIKKYLIRAYQCALGIKNLKVADKIKSDASNSFDIEL